jgi:mannose-6-phosphate isomerase
MTMTETKTPVVPMLLDANQPVDRPYRGGAGIARFRSVELAGVHSPEDFVGSTTEIFSGGGVGLTVLPDGTLLRDAVAANPAGYLGEHHVLRYGPDTRILVKLLDTGERLFVHFHPDDAFAAEHLGRPVGKTEAWIVLAVDPEVAGPDGGYALVGFSHAVDPDTVEAWVIEQDVEAMLGGMNRVPLGVGDTLLVPAGVAHAIGPGLTLVELQQPTDLSILLEYAGFPGLGPANAFLGLDRREALAGLLTEATGPADLDALTGSAAGAQTAESAVRRLFPESADTFFQAWRVDAVAGVPVMLPHSFGILVVLSGSGAVRSDSSTLAVRQGATVLVPYANGPIALDGDVSAIFCAPPAPESPGRI